uniref:Tetratricopeptide repeat-containing protein n=1 Tax=Candidatus Kentrum sp. LFY TaxID=2126342 RepID=A0A450V1X7_9GAMM|nr:MAG: Tetratricopeptide repeat-containing protein [Candidatus Kentron sp. LFY]
MRIVEYTRQGKQERAEQFLGFLRENHRERSDLLAKSLCDLANQIPQSNWRLGLYREAVEGNPMDAIALTSYATALANTGDNERVFELFERSLAVDPDDQITLLELGLFLETQDRYDEAIEYLERIPLTEADGEGWGGGRGTLHLFESGRLCIWKPPMATGRGMFRSGSGISR